MFTLNKKTSNSSEIIESGFSLYKTTWLKCFILSILATGCFLLPLYWPHLLPLQDDQAPNLHENMIYILSLSAAWLLSFVLSTSLIFKLHCEAHNLQSSVIQSIKHSISRFIPTLLVGILYIISVLSGTALLIVPGFILSISLMFCFFFVINENKGVLMALLTSHRLVWGHWWHSFIIMSVPLFLMLSLNMIIFILMAAVFSQFDFYLPNFYMMIFTVHLILQSLIAPFIFCVALTLLHDLRTRQKPSIQTH